MPVATPLLQTGGGLHLVSNRKTSSNGVGGHSGGTTRRSSRGLVRLSRVGDRTEVIRLRSESPLRLMSPRNRSTTAWVVAGSYGGGLLSGDAIDVEIQCDAGTAAVFGTQASTKVYRSGIADEVSRQTIKTRLESDATLISWPDPVTCFKGSRYVQEQHYELAASASLVAVDWLTSGRMARGERWAFDHYASLTTIRTEGRLRVRESLTLDPRSGPLGVVARTGGFDCLGTAWVIGPAFAAIGKQLTSDLGRSPIDPRRPVLFGISPVDGIDKEPLGVVLRFAARTTDAAWRWLRGQLAGALEVVKIDPWVRRG